MSERLDRDAVQRILMRAQELEPSGGPDADPAGIDPEALVAAASDVGIDPDAVRDSLAIERLTVSAPAPRRLDRLAGPESVVVEREIPLSVTDALAGLDAWLTTVHRLVCDRRTDSSLHARRRTDVSARVGRTVAGWRGEGQLAGVSSLDVEAVPQVVGSTPWQPRSILRIRADRHDARTARLAGGGLTGLAGAGAGAATVASDLVVVAPVVALPLMLGGYVIARSGRGQSDRLELQLERLVTLIARGDRPEGLLGKAIRSARTAATRARR